MDRIDTFINEMAQEGFFLSTDHEYINFELWKPGPHNVLFVTGLSGAGKTTLTEQLEKDHNAEMFELDGIDYHYDSSKSGIIKMIDREFPEYAKAVKESKLDQGIAVNIPNEMHVKIITRVIDLMHHNPNQLYICEGVQIFQVPDESLVNEPMIIIGTSTITSFIRRLKRSGGGKINWSATLKNEFLQLCGWYIDESRRFHKFKREYGAHGKLR